MTEDEAADIDELFGKLGKNDIPGPDSEFWEPVREFIRETLRYMPDMTEQYETRYETMIFQELYNRRFNHSRKEHTEAGVKKLLEKLGYE